MAPLPHTLLSSSTLLTPRTIFADRLNRTIGAVYIAMLVTAVLYGVACVQVISYCRHCQRDGLALKLFIFALWIMTTLHIAMISSSMYVNMITHFGDLIAALKISWMTSASILISGLIEFSVRCVFIIRIWRLSDRNWSITIIPMMLNVAVLVLASFATWKALHTKFYSSLFGHPEWSLAAGFILDSIVDVMITGTIALFLWRKRTGFASTDGVMMTMVKFSINTGLITALISIMVLVTFSATKGSYFFTVFYFSIAPVFFISLLITLNARDSMLKTARGGSDNTSGNGALAIKWPNEAVQGEEFWPGDLDRAASTSVPRTKTATSSIIAITVESTTLKMTDGAPSTPMQKSEKTTIN